MNKMDELKIWTLTQKWLMDCNVMFFTETWLCNDVPNSVVHMDGRSLFRADRVAATSGKNKGGGVCIYVNKSWCKDSVIVDTYCSADLEFLIIKCRPFYLPREFTCIIAAAVYVPPDANANVAMKELCAAVSKLQTLHPDGAFIVAGDFNHCTLRSVLPKFHQNVSCTTRGHKTLDHVYTNVSDAYKVTPLPHLGQSDHLSLFLLPKYTPVIKRVKPTIRTVKIWLEGADSTLQHQFQHTDWSEFAAQATTNSQTNIDIYTNSVLEHINRCVSRVTTHKKIKIFPNQKPWMNREVRLLLKARDAAFRSGDREAYSSARANLRKGICQAKLTHKQKIEEHFNSSDPRRMWQGIQSITDYKPPNSVPPSSSASLPDELNHFYARFDQNNKEISLKAVHQPSELPLTLSTSDVYSTLCKVNARKAAGPDGIPGRVLKACAEQLAEVFTDIFNLSLAQTTVPTIFKTSTIVPVPKHSTASVSNDFRPVALTPIIAKCFEKLVASHLKSCLPATLDPFQFAYRHNRSTEDAISTALHSALTHLDSQNTHVRMLFIDFSSAFNTVIPSKLISKLSQLGISTPICNWILDFLTNRPQSVKLDNLSSSIITLNTGVPQGCVLSPLLYSLFTHDCVPVYGSNTIIKFADDTTVVGLIKDDDESAYRDEVQHLAVWCATNNLELNTQKTKEIIVDFRRSRSHAHTPIYINGAVVERVSSFKFLGVHISDDLTWSHNTSTLVKKAQQRLYFLRSLKKVHLNPRILVEFYRCTIESILTNCISVWYSNCSASDRKALQRVVKTAQRITGTQLTSIENIYHKRCLGRARNIIKDASHPNHGLFTLLPSGRRYRSLRSRTSRLRKSFFPEAVTLLNATPPI